MAEQGKNKVASSLLDLQPTAILELFRFYPDKINKPSSFLGFHGGSIFDKSIIWQGVQYLPLAMETEGFDILADGELARPKIRVANQNNIITNLLQNYKDFVNAKVVRKRVSVKYIDDENFEGGNPFGQADPKAELTDETWLMGRKTQESKTFVEFELASPLDLESFSVNSRSVVGKFCYWQYRGEGCRYAGLPIEREDGSPFLDSNNEGVVPNYRKPQNSPVYFYEDKAALWDSTKSYIKGDIVVVESPTIKLAPINGNPNEESVPLKTVFVCVQDNSGQAPEGNPSYWQKDGCSKKLSACRKRFNSLNNISFAKSQNISSGFNCVQISGAASSDDALIPTNTGLFHSTEQALTGALTGAWTIMGWVSINTDSPIGAGVFSTSQRDDGFWPNTRFLNINNDSSSSVSANYMGYLIDPDDSAEDKNAYRKVILNEQQESGPRTWVQYIITHSTGTANFINGEAAEEDTLIKFYVNKMPKSASDQFWWAGYESEKGQQLLADNLGNFASVSEREAMTWDTNSLKALPETFMLGAVEYARGAEGYENSSAMHTTSMNGCLGPWAMWNRVLNPEERVYLYKSIRTPQAQTNNFDFAPRAYYECTGNFGTLTGSGDGNQSYGLNSLIAWWDGTTGDSSIGNGLLDIHTGGFHLTGSGDFKQITESYLESPSTFIANPTPKNPPFGGFPGTDGFSYGRNTQV